MRPRGTRQQGRSARTWWAGVPADRLRRVSSTGLVDVLVGVSRAWAVGGRVRCAAPKCRRRGGAIDIEQPVAMETAGELDLLAATGALHAAACTDREPA